MPIKKAAFKAGRQSKKQTAINRKVKSDLEALVHKVRRMVLKNDGAKVAEWLKQVIKKIDKAAQKRIVKKNTAARLKSRLTQAVNALAKK